MSLSTSPTDPIQAGLHSFAPFLQPDFRDTSGFQTWRAMTNASPYFFDLFLLGPVYTGVTNVPKFVSIFDSESKVIHAEDLVGEVYRSLYCAEGLENALAGDSRTSVDDLRWIKSSLELSMSALAEFMGVTRKTVYDWFDGVTPTRGRKDIKILALKRSLESVESELLPLMRLIWNQSLSSDETLFDILRSGEEDGTALAKRVADALSELQPQIDAIRNAAKKSLNNQFGSAHTEDLVRTV